MFLIKRISCFSNHKDILRENLLALKQDLDPDHSIDVLFGEGVISANEKDDIRQHQVRHQRVDALIDLVSRKGESAFLVFRESLKEDYPHLYRGLHSVK
jgi:hypothetical protein